MFGMPPRVRVEICGDANALYDPATKEIAMCTEIEAYLLGLREVGRIE